MSARSSASWTATLLRKDPGLPVYVVIPGSVIAFWRLDGTTVVEGTANEHSFGRRNLKAWGKGSTDWFLEFTAPFCKAADLKVGDRVSLVLRTADTSLPAELKALLSTSKAHARTWDGLTDRQKREASEHVRAAKNVVARQRRAESIVAKLNGM